MITQERIFEETKNITETNLKNIVIHELKTSGKDTTEDNFEFFLDFLKEIKKEYLYADFIRQYLCKESYKNAKLFLTKLIGCFRIKKVNLNKTLKLIRDNASCILKRCSEWDDLEIPIVSDPSDVNIKCSAAEYKLFRDHSILVMWIRSLHNLSDLFYACFYPSFPYISLSTKQPVF